MRSLVMIIAMMIVGCAAPPPKEAAAPRHEANVAAAESAGYRVIDKDGQTLFCATRPGTGSHLQPCLTETQWENRRLQAISVPDAVGESGRSPVSGASIAGR
jgi:hypothetical protein